VTSEDEKTQSLGDFRFREFLGQAWMKEDKAIKAPRIVMMTQKFNEVRKEF